MVGAGDELCQCPYVYSLCFLVWQLMVGPDDGELETVLEERDLRGEEEAVRGMFPSSAHPGWGRYWVVTEQEARVPLETKSTKR